MAGLALAATPLVGLAPAYACSCLAGTDAEHLGHADVVFKGTVLKLVAPPDHGVQSSFDPVTYVFDVSRAYKGRVADPQRVRTARSGASCGLGLSGKGPYLVFASAPPRAKGTKAPKNRVLEADLCGGTRPIGARENPAFGAGRPVPSPAAAPAPVTGHKGGHPAATPDTESTLTRLLGPIL